MKPFIAFVMALVVTCQTAPVFAASENSDRATDCVQLVEKAISFIEEKGGDYALKVFSAQKGPFIDKELYVFAVSMENVILAHPYRRDLIGENVSEMKDLKGKPLFAHFKQTAEESGSGWVEYWWAKTAEKEQFQKASFVKKVPGRNMYVGAGYYK
ncbi:MAG: cache domain-containing protein [Desulfomonile tiedjei]|nr:cache domain-containing protein [Desulfomonile tiedjei]